MTKKKKLDELRVAAMVLSLDIDPDLANSRHSAAEARHHAPVRGELLLALIEILDDARHLYREDAYRQMVTAIADTLIEGYAYISEDDSL